MAHPSSMKIIRLRKGGRYIVMVAGRNGDLASGPFWSEAQALAASRLPAFQWSSIPTEVFTEIHSESVPEDVYLFARSSRRGQVHGVVLWTKDGVFPKIFDTVADAVSEANCRAGARRKAITMVRAA
jgi:hypothetical protein